MIQDFCLNLLLKKLQNILIFEQTIFESSLSKFASRMVSLDKSADNVGSKIKHLSFNLSKAKHKDINAGLESRLFGGILWR
jgi:F0F1-type ATP synthase gamma subunit